MTIKDENENKNIKNNLPIIIEDIKSYKINTNE